MVPHRVQWNHLWLISFYCLGAVDIITEKHVSFNIDPDHYPVVGSCLLKAVKDVLGDAATDDILEAWGEGYNFLAEILKKVEKDKAEKKAAQEGGWIGYKKLVVSRREKESDLVTSFYFKVEMSVSSI